MAGYVAVCKFGGGVLSCGADFERAAGILCKKPGRAVAVVSAVRGITDLLASAVERRDAAFAQECVERFLAVHSAIAEVEGLAALADGLRSALLGCVSSPSARNSDYALSFGERASAVLLGHFINEPCAVLDSESAGIVSNGVYGNASCDVGLTRENFSRSLFAAGSPRLAVITGFYGVDRNGNVNLFGRGGSDYSAGAVAAACGARSLELYKDVDGFLSADPRVVSGPTRICSLSFSEASELCHLGAKIIHPRAFEPLRGLGVRVEIRPVSRPGFVGTVLSEGGRSGRRVSAVASSDGVALVEVCGPDSCAFAAGAFCELSAAGVSVGPAAFSPAGFSFAMRQSDCALVGEALGRLSKRSPSCSFRVSGGRSTVSLVGSRIGPAEVARATECLNRNGIGLQVLSYGASRSSLSAVVDSSDERRAVAALHSSFFEIPEVVVGCTS